MYANTYLAWDERRSRLALGGPKRVQTWSLPSGSKIAEFTPYKTGLRRLILDKQSGVIFTGGDGALYPDRPPIPGRPETFAGIEDDPDTLVRAWDPTTGRLVRTYLGPGRNVNGLALSPSGKYLVATKSRDLELKKDSYVLAWDVASGRLITASSYGQGFPAAVAFNRSGEKLALATDGGIQIIQLDPELFP